MMRKAKKTDINRIMTIIGGAVRQMHVEGNRQWDEQYPARSHFMKDLADGDLYVAELGGIVAGVICVNDIELAEYAAVAWRRPDAPLVVHRLAVAVEARRTLSEIGYIFR